MTPVSPPSNTTYPPHVTPSPTLIQMHTTVNAMAKGLDMSSLEGLPLGYAPPPAQAGKPVANLKLAESDVAPPSPMTIPVKAPPTRTLSKAQDSYPSFLQSPNLIGGAIRTLGKMKNAVGIPSKKSSSSKSKNTKKSAFATWSRPKIPHIVTIATGSVSARKTKSNSRLSPNDYVVFTHEDEIEAQPALTGGAQTSPEGGTTSDASVSPKGVVPPTPDGTLTNPDDRTSPEGGMTSDVSASPRGVVPPAPDNTLTNPGDRTSPTGDGQTNPDGGLTSDITVSHANKVPPEVQTVLNDKARKLLELEQHLADDLEAHLLAKPKSPVSQPNPDSIPDLVPAPGSIEIEGFSSITHTSSSDATNPSGTPITQGTLSPPAGSAPGTGEHTAEAPTPPPPKPSNTSVSPANPKPIPLHPGTKPPPMASTSTGITGNAGTTPRSKKLYGLLPCTTPGENESGSAQTAAQTEVESLVRTSPGNTQGATTVPPINPAINNTGFYWVGRLLPQVDQTLVPRFTPSPFQLFLKVIIHIFDVLMNGQQHGDQRKGHTALSTIAGFLTNEGEATSWFIFHNWNTNEITHVLMSYGVCTLTLKGVRMGNYLPFFILAIEGVVRAMKELCDYSGAVFAMDAHSPPVVSIYDIINRAEEHAAPRRSDPEVMNLMDYRIQMIINTLSPLDDDFD